MENRITRRVLVRNGNVVELFYYRRDGTSGPVARVPLDNDAMAHDYCVSVASVLGMNQISPTEWDVHLH